MYGQIVQVLMTSVVSSEAEIVVGEAIRGVAEGFVQRRARSACSRAWSRRS